MLKRNLGYKILAISAAIVIWFYANEGQNPRITKDVRVSLDVRKVDPHRIVTDAPQSVKVTLEGARSHIESLAAEPDAIMAYVNLQGKNPGRQVLPVIVRVPEGFLGLVTATPAPREVPVSVEERISRMMMVSVQFTGSPPVGYRFSRPALSPSRVAISGTAKQTSAVSQVILAVDTKFATDGSIDDYFAVSAVDEYGKAVKGLTLNPEKVHLHLDLVEAPASRVVFISPEIVGQPPFPCKVTSIEVSPQTISVTGRPEQLMNVTTIKTKPISIGSRTKTFSQVVPLLAPPGLSLVKGDAVRVTVKIEEEAQPAP